MPHNNLIYTGADAIVYVRLTELDSSTFIVSNNSIVTGVLIDPKTQELVSPIKTILSTDYGNDWSTGLVVIPLTAADTEALEERVYGIEVKVINSKIYKARVSLALCAVESVIV